MKSRLAPLTVLMFVYPLACLLVQYRNPPPIFIVISKKDPGEDPHKALQVMAVQTWDLTFSERVRERVNGHEEDRFFLNFKFQFRPELRLAQVDPSADRR